MTAFTNYLETKLLGVTICGSVFTAPTTIYVGLATVLSTDGDVITEVNTGSYARRAVTFGAPTSGICLNSGTITFPQATADWGTVNYVVLYDASTSGNALYWSALLVPRPVITNDTLVFPASSLSVTLD